MSSDLFFYTSSDDEDEVNNELAMMSRRLFTKKFQEVTDASRFFQQRDDCAGHRGISALMKYTFAIRQLAYGCVPGSLDEYLQMSGTKPVNVSKSFVRGDHGPDPFILLKAIASNDLWIWHAFFGVSGMNNDVNVLRQSPLFNDLKSRRAPDVPFMANNVPYKRGYYLTNGIYPQWSVLIKSIKNSGMNDHKRILYKTKHEAARKDVERAFGVLKQKWKIVKYPARGLTQRTTP
ncbi:ALP1-like protein [Tanacetum coccineum]